MSDSRHLLRFLRKGFKESRWIFLCKGETNFRTISIKKKLMENFQFHSHPTPLLPPLMENYIFYYFFFETFPKTDIWWAPCFVWEQNSFKHVDFSISRPAPSCRSFQNICDYLEHAQSWASVNVPDSDGLVQLSEAAAEMVFLLVRLCQHCPQMDSHPGLMGQRWSIVDSPKKAELGLSHPLPYHLLK